MIQQDTVPEEKLQWIRAWDCMGMGLEPTGAWKLSFRPHGPRAWQHIFHSPPSCWDNLETTHSCAEGPPTSCTNHASSTSQTRPQQSSEPVTKRVLSGLKDAVVTLARICSRGHPSTQLSCLNPSQVCWLWPEPGTGPECPTKLCTNSPVATRQTRAVRSAQTVTAWKLWKLGHGSS